MIQHVTRPIAPSKLELVIEFYALLGFRRTPEPPDLAGRAAWLQLGPTQLHLMLTDETDAELGHVGLVIERYEETVARLRRAGHFVEDRREHWGSPRAYVRDPAGHLVEIMAFGPGEQRE